jgi:hypothetical protein
VDLKDRNFTEENATNVELLAFDRASPGRRLRLESRSCESHSSNLKALLIMLQHFPNPCHSCKIDSTKNYLSLSSESRSEPESESELLMPWLSLLCPQFAQSVSSNVCSSLTMVISSQFGQYIAYTVCLCGPCGQVASQGRGVKSANRSLILGFCLLLWFGLWEVA